MTCLTFLSGMVEWLKTQLKETLLKELAGPMSEINMFQLGDKNNRFLNNIHNQ